MGDVPSPSPVRSSGCLCVDLTGWQLAGEIYRYPRTYRFCFSGTLWPMQPSYDEEWRGFGWRESGVAPGVTSWSLHTQFVRGEDKPIAATATAVYTRRLCPSECSPSCPWGLPAVGTWGAVAGLCAGSRNRGRGTPAAPDTPYTPEDRADDADPPRAPHATAAARLPSGPREGAPTRTFGTAGHRL